MDPYSCNSIFVLWNPNSNIISYTAHTWNNIRCPGPYLHTPSTEWGLYL